MNKNVFVVGFMLFAIFFGAGNLIFPPKLGAESGLDFWVSISGFILTGVGLPLLGIAVASAYDGGYKAILQKVHPAFAMVFLIAIYLAIGPFFGGPRTAATAYDIAIMPFFDEPNATTQFIFCLIYFAIALWLSLNPSQMVERVGTILTPMLLLGLVLLVVRSYFLLQGADSVAVAQPISAPFFNGAIEGYYTLDAVGSVTVAVVVVTAIKEKSQKGVSLTKQVIYAGVVAAVLLAIIYIALGWIGNHLPVSAGKSQNIGANILNASAVLAFGEFGRILLGLIVTLACLTTVIGLGTATSEYFHETFPKISYKTYVVIFMLVSFFVANIGLNAVISKSLPVLLIIYPITMTIIFLFLANLFIRIPLPVHRFAIGFVTVISILSVLGKGHLDVLETLPLKSYSMEWMPFALAGVVVGYLWQVFVTKKPTYIER